MSNRDDLIHGMSTAPQVRQVNKSSMTSAANTYFSLWTLGGLPAAGAAPTTTAVICTNATTGALSLNNAPAGLTNHLIEANLVSSTSPLNFKFYDRLVHVGGLVGNIATPQAVSFDLTGVSAERLGSPGLEEVELWLENYGSTGGTAVTLNLTYTNLAGVSGQVTQVSLPASGVAGRHVPIIGLNGEAIASVQSIQHASMGLAGTYGITAMRYVGGGAQQVLSLAAKEDWSSLRLAKVANDACVFLQIFTSSSSFGGVSGHVAVAAMG